MTIYRAILSVKRYGIVGVWNWLLNHKLSALESLLASTVKADCKPTTGITVIGDLSGRHSLCKVLRDFVLALEQCDIPHQVFDTAKPIPSAFVANRYSDIIGMFQSFKIPGAEICRQHKIVFWEFESGFIECHPDCLDTPPLLVFSDFCLKSLQSQVGSHNTISKIRYPFHFQANNITPRTAVREKFGIPQDAFVVFYNFDYSSSYYRKNPEGILLAFATAFRNNFNTILVFKTKESKSKASFHEKLISESERLNVKNRVRFVTDFLSNQELVSLTAACDAYVSLHRGEGFGLGVAEAMCMGLPVVASKHGATNEFCNHNTAELIQCKQMPPQSGQIDHANYQWVKSWSEPDIQEAAFALKKLYENPAYREDLGKRGQKFVTEYFSRENFTKSIQAFLAEASTPDYTQ